MLRFEKVAIALSALTVVISLNVAFGDHRPNAIVSALLAVVTKLPAPSCTATVPAGVIVAPAVAELGELVNASFVAALATVNAELVAEVKPVAVATNV